jgi:large subunit ribosomal protein L31
VHGRPPFLSQAPLALKWERFLQVFCNGTEVMTVGGTKETYNVDIYSGNHPWCGPQTRP